MIKAGIVGGTGYTGVELMRILARHSQVELAVITSTSLIAVTISSLCGFSILKLAWRLPKMSSHSLVLVGSGDTFNSLSGHF